MTDIIERLITVYGEPKTDNPDLFIAEYAKALRGFDQRVLEFAADNIFRTHTYPTWPTLGEIVRTANEVAAELYDNHRKPEHSKAPLAEPTPEQKERVAEVMRMFAKTMDSNNTFAAILARCPVGGTIKVDAPWGEEVRDRRGNVVPIREKDKLRFSV